MSPDAEHAAAIAFGRRLVPLGFVTLPVVVDPLAFCFGGTPHVFHGGAYLPAVLPKARPSRWLPGPATEPMVDLAAGSVEEFSVMAAEGLEEFSHL